MECYKNDMVVMGERACVSFWKLTTSQPEKLAQLPFKVVTCLCLIPENEGFHVAVVGRTTVTICHVDIVGTKFAVQQLLTWTTKTYVLSVAYAKRANRFFCAMSIRALREYRFDFTEGRAIDVDDPSPRAYDTHDDVKCVAVSPDEVFLATSGNEGTCLWSLESSHLLLLHKISADAPHLFFTRDSQHLVTCSAKHNSFQVWPTNQPLLLEAEVLPNVHKLASGNKFICGILRSTTDPPTLSIDVFDVETPQVKLRSLQKPGVAHYGTRVLCLSEDETLLCVPTQNGFLFYKLMEDTATNDQGHDLPAFECPLSPGTSMTVRTARFDASGTFLVAVDASNIFVIDVSTSKSARLAQTHQITLEGQILAAALVEHPTLPNTLQVFGATESHICVFNCNLHQVTESSFPRATQIKSFGEHPLKTNVLFAQSNEGWELWDIDPFEQSSCPTVLRTGLFSSRSDKSILSQDKTRVYTICERRFTIWGFEGNQPFLLAQMTDSVSALSMAANDTLAVCTQLRSPSLVHVQKLEGDPVIWGNHSRFPPNFLWETCDIDRQAALESQRLSLLKAAVALRPISLFHGAQREGHFEAPFLLQVASQNGHDDVLEAIFSVSEVPAFLSLDDRADQSLLGAVVDSNDRLMVKRVCDHIIASREAGDVAATCPSHQTLPGWNLTAGHCDDIRFTLGLIKLIQAYPQIACEFLAKLGLAYQARPAFECVPLEDRKLAMPASGMYVSGTNSTSNKELLQFLHQSREHSSDTEITHYFEPRMIPFPHAASLHLSSKRQGGKQESTPGLLTCLAQTASKMGSADIFGCLTAQALVRFKWEYFAYDVFVRKMIFYLLMLILMVALSFTLDRANPVAAKDANEPSEVASIVLAAILLILVLHDVFREARQLTAAGLYKYFSDFFNCMDVAQILLTFATAFAVFAGDSSVRPLLATAVYLKWFGVLYFLQAFESTGPLVRMVVRITHDIRYILLLLTLGVLATGHAFFILLEHENDSLGYDGIGNSLFTSFNMVVLGAFESDGFTVGRDDVLLRLLFIVSMVLISIVLLNIIIALMSDSFEKIASQSINELFFLRARLILELEQLLKSDKSKREPKWIHVLVPQGAGTNIATGAQWQGVLHALQEDVQKNTKSVRIELEEVKKAICEDVKHNLSGVTSEIADMKSNMKKIDEKLAQLLDQQGFGLVETE
eukprot:m.236650 g.236650  ORF g.236650 m.236650 type:complete len:1190 (-) comp26550_c0_seq4:31-3600(-)